MVFMAMLLIIFYDGFWTPFYTAAQNTPVPYALIGFILAFGLMISALILGIIHITARKRAYELFLLILWPPLMFAMVSMAAATEGSNTRECKEPFTAIYDGGNQKPDHREACPIMFLERGLLLYDKGARATIFIPWSQLKELTSSAGNL